MNNDIDYFIAFIAILLGLIFGSFATAVAYRLPRGQQFITDRSKCPECNHILGVLDLFPVFSWLLLRGKCRYCHKDFGQSYPLIEIGLSGMFLLTYMQYGISLTAIIVALIATAIMILIAIDFEHYIIPDGLNLTLFILGIAYQYSIHGHWLQFTLGPLAGLAIGYLLRWIIYVWKKKEGLGLGDVKFLAAAGTMIAPENLAFFLFVSGFIGLITALIWKILGKGERFPFGPSLSLSLFIIIVLPNLSQLWLKGFEHLVYGFLY